MRADLVEHSKLAFKRSENGRHTGIARRSRREVFHGKIPSKREPFSGCPHCSCVAGDGAHIALMPYGNLQRETT
jgi:hypothetical protein